ncbi:MAG: FAD:protein FMN transferase [Dehalococcoidia bacterium]|nr:MAG: FAD:protein FMN transferase [Dehalococcoidia bacterium]
MDTGVTIEVWPPGDMGKAREAISRAFNWFHLVETTCNRFDRDSELARLSATVWVPVAVSPLLFRLLQFAIGMAEASEGAFDPTVGDAMIRAGFRYGYRDGVESSPQSRQATASYRDISIDVPRRKVTLETAMTLDLGAVAKGFAIDLASEELHKFPNHMIAAGGDLLVRGAPPGLPSWPIQVRDPRDPATACRVLEVRDAAVCTSGSYLRTQPDVAEGHHLLDPVTGQSAHGLISATVVASSGMLADALATAACVLGPARALPLIARYDAEALLIDPSFEMTATPGLDRSAP